jgi:hypothetical protein
MEFKEVRKGRFSSISPVAVREYYARPVQVNEGIKTSLPMKARPAPIMIVKSPTPQIISWKPIREASPLLINNRPESSNGSLTI